MASIEGENTTSLVVSQGPDGVLLLPVLGGENSATTAGASGSSSTPRASVDSRSGIIRRSVRS